MANEEHLTLLKGSVDLWNTWRDYNPAVNPDLREADLSGLDLFRVKLGSADLSGCNLSKTNLFRANLRLASFHCADLREANLQEANLREADLVGANLYKANLQDAYLVKVDLSDAKLQEVNLQGANLQEAILCNTDLSQAVLVNTNLNEADLRWANLTGADLTNTDLSVSNVIETNFTRAEFTGACLAGWNSDSTTILNGAECKYVYLKWRTQERRPYSEDFKPGEFTKLFQQALNTVDLIFRNGVDWQALLFSIEKLRIEAHGAELTIQAIENKNDGAFVVRVNVPYEANKAEIERFLKRQYELEVKAIDEKYQFQLQLQGERLEEYRDQIKIQRQENTDLRRIVEKMADKEAPKYDMRGSSFGNFADTVQSGAKFQDTQNIYSSEQRQNLAEAAAEIQQLLEQLAQTNPTSTVVAEAIHQEIKRNPTLQARLVNALKAGTLEGLKTMVNHPLFSIPAETVKGWLEAE